MGSINDSFLDLEQYRSQLENNVTKLRISLRHWQTWEVEYEGMKEEIAGLGEKHSDHDLAHVGSDFGGTLLNDKEVELLFMDSNGQQRRSSQIIDLLSKRIDYVQTNIKTIEGQLDSVERKLNLSDDINRSVVRDEEGLPITDIREELDDEGNVISSSATPAADTTPRIVEALRKAGVKDLPEISKRKEGESESETSGDRDQRREEIKDEMSAGNTGNTVPDSILVKRPTEDRGSSSPSSPQKDNGAPLEGKKSVSFAEGTKTEDSKISRKRQPNPIFAKFRSPPAIATAETVLDVQQKPPHEQLTALLNAEANLMRNTSSIDSDSITSPVIPEKESPEDAALRRQMLQYNMQQVGAVVAEIDLDDEVSTPPYSEDEDQDDYEDTSEEEEEDKHGRSIGNLLSDEYIEKMKALEQRLNASMLENAGPNASPKLSMLSQLQNLNVPVADPGKVATAKSKNSPTKGVHFAEELNVQEAPPQDELEKRTLPIMTPDRASFANTESTVPKVSRFKKARNMNSQSQPENVRPSTPSLQPPSRPIANETIEHSAPNTSSSFESKLPTTAVSEQRARQIPTGPTDRPHADTIIERPFIPDPDISPQEPDEFDPELLQQQVATEYYRQRNRMIYRQGGFLHEEEGEEMEVPVDEEGKKVSRFMAARLGSR